MRYKLIRKAATQDTFYITFLRFLFLKRNAANHGQRIRVICVSVVPFLFIHSCPSVVNAENPKKFSLNLVEGIKYKRVNLYIRWPESMDYTDSHTKGISGIYEIHPEHNNRCSAPSCKASAVADAGQL